MDDLKSIDPGQLKSVFGDAPTRPEPIVSKTRSTFRRRVDRRRFVTHENASRAADQLESLPEANETIHARMTPRAFSAFDYIPATLELAGCPAERVTILTLGINERHLLALRDMVDAGQIGHVQLVVSDYFRGTDRETFGNIASTFNRRPEFELGVARSHCKVFAIELKDGRCIVFDGSPNARSCNSYENIAAAQSRGLYDWYADFAAELLGADHARP